MKNFIVSDNKGVILRTGTCSDIDLELQSNNDEFVMEGICEDSDNHTVVNGQLIYTPKVPTVDEVQDEIRETRNYRLRASDWTQMPDAPLSDSKKLEWATYRQQLRDLPSLYLNETDINNVVFPEKP